MASNHPYFTIKTTPSVCKQAIFVGFEKASKREGGGGGGAFQF